ncbi:B-cell receptor CD22-like [Strigops habroptila]|uniref:B-cell receptor CD22-like n=1 Tax=Strigops habroptila TaxID=2489341 RepID=UPI0011CF5A48|nr:B-cell receptor CD22-like [Strigops habroptila]
MWVFFWVLLLMQAAPGSGSRCPDPISAPSELVATLGSCLYISCRYELCSAGPGAQLLQLRWLHGPTYNKAMKDFKGVQVADLQRTPTGEGGDDGGDGWPEGDNCGLVLRRMEAAGAGVYGIRMVASKGMRWMHFVNVSVTDPLTHGQRAQIGCWVPPPCPEDPHSLLWDGPVTTSRGAHVDPWTPPATVTPHPALGTLLSFEASWDHDGTLLRCLHKGPDGATISEASWRLQVHYAPRDVWVKVTPSGPIHEGQEVTLSCGASANPPPHTFRWSRGGAEPLPHSAAQLRLRPRGGQDGGSYTCRVSNELGTGASPPATIEVYYPPRAAILDPLTPLPALIGSNVTLGCSLGPAHPPPLVQWRRGDGWVGPGSGHALSFRADPALAGSYRCIGWNEAGTVQSEPIDVIVLYPPPAVQVLPPHIGPIVAGGGPIRLRCQVTAGEPPRFQVTWLKDGQDLRVPSMDLVLPGPEPSDAASYTCQARNSIGTTTSTPLPIDVHYGPQGVELVPEPGPRVQEGTNVTLRCRGAARPPPRLYQWVRDGASLGWSRKGLWVVPSAPPEASGRYRCRATNEVGDGESDDVMVKVYYSPTTILQKTCVGLAVGLSLLLPLAIIGFLFYRRCHWHTATNEEPVVEPTRTFFLCNKRPMVASPRGPRGLGDTTSIIYSTLRAHVDGATKVHEGPDYENVPSGAIPMDGAVDEAMGGAMGGDMGGTLVYATLALPNSGAQRGRAGAEEDGVEYTDVRH